MCLFCDGNHPLTCADLSEYAISPADARRIYYGQGFASKTGYAYATSHSLFCENCAILAHVRIEQIRELAHSDGWRLYLDSVTYEKVSFNHWRCTSKLLPVTGTGYVRNGALEDLREKVRAMAQNVGIDVDAY